MEVEAAELNLEVNALKAEIQRLWKKVKQIAPLQSLKKVMRIIQLLSMCTDNIAFFKPNWLALSKTICLPLERMILLHILKEVWWKIKVSNDSIVDF